MPSAVIYKKLKLFLKKQKILLKIIQWSRECQTRRWKMTTKMHDADNTQSKQSIMRSNAYEETSTVLEFSSNDEILVCNDDRNKVDDWDHVEEILSLFPTLDILLMSEFKLMTNGSLPSLSECTLESTYYDDDECKDKYYDDNDNEIELIKIMSQLR